MDEHSETFARETCTTKNNVEDVIGQNLSVLIA